MEKKPPIKIASRKAKGRNLQKHVAEMVSFLIGYPWGKDELIRSREMGQSGPDVVLIGDALRAFPFAIECKAQETWSLPAWIKQAKKSADGMDLDWLLVCKRSREQPVVVMDLGAFQDMCQIIIKGGGFDRL